MSRLIAILPVVFALIACSPRDPEPVLLTVISEADGEPAPKHGLFERYGLEGRSHSFTIEDLASLDQHDIRRAITEGAPVQTYSGPRLPAVLDAAGHALALERPEMLGALMRDWLTRLRTSLLEDLQHASSRA